MAGRRAYLQLVVGGVPLRGGGSTESFHQGWIDVENFGLTDAVPEGRTGIELLKPVDHTSQTLWQAQVSGSHFDSGTLDIDLGSTRASHHLAFKDVMVSGHKLLYTNSTDPSLEHIVLAIAQVRRAEGLRSSAESVGWETSTAILRWFLFNAR